MPKFDVIKNSESCQADVGAQLKQRRTLTRHEEGWEQAARGFRQTLDRQSPTHWPDTRWEGYMEYPVREGRSAASGSGAASSSGPARSMRAWMTRHGGATAAYERDGAGGGDGES